MFEIPVGHSTIGRSRHERFSTRLGLALAVLGALALPLSGHATVVSGTFTGIMDAGTDTGGYFGSAGYIVTGKTITGTFAYDTATLSAPNCTVIPGHACYTAPGITISETIAGTGSYTFHGTNLLVAAGLDLYGNFPVSSSLTDAMTMVSGDGTPGVDFRDTTVEFRSTTNNFVPVQPNPALSFSLTSADMSSGTTGNIFFQTGLQSENLSFQFVSQSIAPNVIVASTDDQGGGGSPMPEPASLVLFGTAVLGLAALSHIYAPSKARFPARRSPASGC